MNIRFLPLLFCLFPGLLFSRPDLKEKSTQISDEEKSDSLRFGEELGAEELVTWYELEEMAAGYNQIVLPDCSLGGIRDDLARWIPLEGLELTLRPVKMRRVFLYIDFVGFFDREYESIVKEHACLPSFHESRFKGKRAGPYGYVEIYIEGQRRGIYYHGHDAGFSGPIAVPVAREEFSNGKVHVKIVPSNRSFAVWDLFLSHAPPEE